MRRSIKGVSTSLHPDFHKKINEARIKFMKQYNIDRLTTVAFTGMLANKKAFGLQNEKHKKRRCK